ncbi:MAG: serine kinase [Roseovarius sp.]
MTTGDMSGAHVMHATCVTVGARAVLIRGASGRGKSGLALQLMAMGAVLVSDDRTRLWRAGDTLMADAPGTIRGRIEARGVGILRVPPSGPVPVVLLVDLDLTATDRLPPPVHETVMGVALPCIENVHYAHFPATILLYLRHGMQDQFRMP